ncbi:MAG TPA: acetylglutamate kinase [Gemmataceae bacterium]|jgi:acetylglutamate kinase|nr:acetylglutamate kinase [Gemmataceae bacterium]
MEAAIRKADVLIEALPYIRRFRDRFVVIKLGGSAMEEPEALLATLQDAVFMATVGIRPILVHGGGKAIDRAMAHAGLIPKKVRGRRYTDEATLAIVVQELRKLALDIEKSIRQLGGRAVAMAGGSLQCLHATQIALESPDEPSMDLGRVGRVTKVDVDLLTDLSSGGVMPVISCVGEDADGGFLNINADEAAAAVAANLRAEKLVMLTDTPGILRDQCDEQSLIRSVDAAGCRELIREGIIDRGMIPKVEACLESLAAGVGKIHIIDGRVRHSLLLEIYTDVGIGTQIR